VISEFEIRDWVIRRAGYQVKEQKRELDIRELVNWWGKPPPYGTTILRN